MLDGVGLAPAGPSNAVADGLGGLAARIGAPLDSALAVRGPGVAAHGIDATLGVPGRPQSGTGHTTIYGGYNAAAANGRHQPSFPTLAMQARLREDSLFHAVRARGGRAAWATAALNYPPPPGARHVRYTGGMWAALGAGLAIGDLAALERGTALGWDLDHHLARRRPGCEHLPLLAPDEAAARLVAIAAAHDLTAFDCYLPDLAGHGRLDITLDAALALVDAVLAALLDRRPTALTVVVTSDHGNVEDLTTAVHTRNPVPLIAIGPGAARIAPVESLDQIMAALLTML